MIELEIVSDGALWWGPTGMSPRRVSTTRRGVAALVGDEHLARTDIGDTGPYGVTWR